MEGLIKILENHKNSSLLCKVINYIVKGLAADVEKVINYIVKGLAADMEKG